MTEEKRSGRPGGLTAFYIVLVGQAASMLGTAMANFGLTLWAFEETGLATALALVGFFFMTPLLIMSPFAGAIVDRNNRKLMMIISDGLAGVATIIILILFYAGVLEVWHLYISATVAGIAQSFQWPAFSASMSVMIEKEQYGRANGILSFAQNGSAIFAPIAGAAVYGLFGLGVLLLLDVVTFTIAIGTLLIVFIPDPEKTEEGKASEGSFWQESMFGFRYIWQRKSLFGMQIVFTIGNFFSTIVFTLAAPMILARTMNNEFVLGSVQSVGAIGGIVGALVMSWWGGPKRLVHGVFIGWIVGGVLGDFIIGIGRGPILWSLGFFFISFIIPILNGSNQAIWQRKVPADLQGRVFSIRRLLAWVVNPVATLIAGPLADFVMEPAMMDPNGSALQSLFGWYFGTGPGAGMAVLIAIAGLIAGASGIWPYFVPIIRDIEDILPDHTQEVMA